MGRPKGSKNKKTLAREAALAAESVPTQATGTQAAPRRRGRPPGSKNRKTIEREQARATNSVEFDKYDNVYLNGAKIGCIDYDDGVFIGKNQSTGRQARAFDYDYIVAWFKGENISQETSA